MHTYHWITYSPVGTGVLGYPQYPGILPIIILPILLWVQEYWEYSQYPGIQCIFGLAILPWVQEYWEYPRYPGILPTIGLAILRNTGAIPGILEYIVPLD